ncbi:hypothetical protein GGI07_005621, partial [Coemansia sp. Benny D115]
QQKQQQPARNSATFESTPLLEGSAAAPNALQQPSGALTASPSPLPLVRKLSGYIQGTHKLFGEISEDTVRGFVPIGIITLEDVIEELIQEEIIDETDVFIDMRQKIKVMRAVKLVQNLTASPGKSTAVYRAPTAPGDEDEQHHQQHHQQMSMQLPKQQRGGQQESIFKTIMRRLSRVERNITLAYHYLEEQHLVFRMVLQQVEMNNLENVQLAIRQLNHTTAKQMQSLTTLSEEVWRAILYDLEEYQQQTQADMTRMAGRLEFLAEEVLFEKRMNVAQLVLLLTIIVMITVNRVVTKLALIPESKKEK